MTAPTREAPHGVPGRWWSGPGSAMREVIVSMGETSLVIAEPGGPALSHWSLPAVERIGQGAPARYTPGPDASESLVLEDASMIAAIERVRRAMRPRRTRRLGRLVAPLVLLAALVVGVVYGPEAVRDYAAQAVPAEVRAEIGAALLARLEGSAGPRCAAPDGVAALRRLEGLLAPALGGPVRITVLEGLAEGAPLPGGVLVLPGRWAEVADPDIAAGDALAAVPDGDPLEALLADAGIVEAGHLLTAARLSNEALEAATDRLLLRPATELEAEVLLPRFAAADLSATPYGKARGRADLVAADPAPDAPPALSDADWAAIRAICG